MGTALDYPNVEQWQPGKPYSPPARVRHNGNIFDLVFGQNETYEPGVGDPNQNGWRFYDELYDQTPHTRTDHAKIIAYIPTWRTREGFNYANDDIYRYVTHGIISFLMFSEVTLSAFEPQSLEAVNIILADVVNTGHRNGTRISIALGGATDYGFLSLMTHVGNHPDNPLLDRAVQNVVNFVNFNNLDGVDLDLECWWGKPGERDQGGRPKTDGPHPAGSALTLFAQRLKEAMPDKLISAAVFGTSWYGNNYDPRIADYVDWLGVMTYDLTGSWNNSPVGPHTALFKVRNLEAYAEEQQAEWPGGGMENNPILAVEDSLWYWTNPSFMNWQGPGQNIPRNKITAGVPIYGYDFAYGKDPDDLSGQVPPGYRSMRYRDILTQFPDAYAVANGNIKVSGSTPRPAFIAAPGNYAYAHNIYLETPDTAVRKLNFLTNVGAQGVIIWELTNDVWEERKSIIKALYTNSGNPDTRLALASKTPKPSDVLVLATDRIGSYTNEFAAEIAQGREKQTSLLGTFVTPSLMEVITRFFDEAGKPEGQQIRREDKDAIMGMWTAIEEAAKQYNVDSPEADGLLTDLENKVDGLVALLVPLLGGVSGWVVVPFYSMVAMFQTYISLERFARQNPSEEHDTDEEKEKQCGRQADEVSHQIQQAIDMLTSARQKWPTMDLGSIESVLGIPGVTTPPLPPVQPPPPLPPVQHSYSVQIVVNISVLTIVFKTSAQGIKMPVFTAYLRPFPIIGYTVEGNATLNYDVDWLVNQNWEADVDFTYGPGGANVHLWGLSGEDIGSVSSSNSTGLISGDRRGRGSFSPI